MHAALSVEAPKPLWFNSPPSDSPWGVDLIGLNLSRHSRTQIVEAGKFIAAKLEYNDANRENLLTAFRVAHDWRLAHIQPMRSVRKELSRCAGQDDSGITVTAGRLKRMQSIRRKLQRSPLTLYQIQDIAGCRAITSSIASLEKIVEYYKSDRCPHSIQRENDYINNPRTAYRSHHLVLKFNGGDKYSEFNRQTVEVQLRTELQHAWATAVEAVGLVRDEDLKAGRGDAKWLRFFDIMATELAIEENKPIGPGVSKNAKERLNELRQLDVDLDAVRSLESYNHAIKTTSDMSGASGMSFLIRYDNMSRTVSVRHRSKFATLSEEYFDDEMLGSGTTVLVDVDKVSDLRAAYPNYYLDVDLFVGRVKRVLSKSARSAAPRKAVGKFDLDWWFNRRSL